MTVKSILSPESVIFGTSDEVASGATQCDIMSPGATVEALKLILRGKRIGQCDWMNSNTLNSNTLRQL